MLGQSRPTWPLGWKLQRLVANTFTKLSKAQCCRRNHGEPLLLNAHPTAPDSRRPASGWTVMVRPLASLRRCAMQIGTRAGRVPESQLS